MPGWAFDRAAGYYDATRALPAAVQQVVAEILAGELAGRGVALEIGVGTGRIALPLHDQGVALVGSDLAFPMLQRLVENAGGCAPFPLVLADATAQPFGDAVFGAVLASHVLHLVPPWRRAVDEAMRVVRAGGVLLVDFGGGEPAPWIGPVRQVMARLGVEHVRPGVSAPGPVADHLGDGATSRALAPVELPVRRSLAQDLDQWERQIHSWTWQYPAEQVRAACEAVRTWAHEHGKPLDEQVELRRVIQWWAFDKAERPGVRR